MKILSSNRIIIPKVAFSYAGAIVGAGFTSGQELMQFFVSLESGIIPALILTTALFAVFGWATLNLSRIYQSTDYGSFLKCLLGPRIAQVFDILISVFLLGTLGIMMSAAGAVFEEHLGYSFQVGVGFISICIALVLISDVQGILWLNTVLMPAKFLIVLIVTVLIVFMPVSSLVAPDIMYIHPEPIGQSWYMASVLYVSYNLILGLAVLTSLGAANRSPKLSVAGIWGGLGLGAFAAIIVIALINNWPTVSQYQIPMLFLASQVHPVVKLLYTLVLVMGILTTAVACAYTLTIRSMHWIKSSYGLTLIFILILAMPLAQFGFARLVHVIYPLFGYAGIILLGCLAWRTYDSF